MTVYEVMIDDTGSLTSQAHSFGLFSTRDKAQAYLDSLDWLQDWMYNQIIEREVDVGFGQYS
jgi:hypothetical protein